MEEKGKNKGEVEGQEWEGKKRWKRGKGMEKEEK